MKDSEEQNEEPELKVISQSLEEKFNTMKERWRKKMRQEFVLQSGGSSNSRDTMLQCRIKKIEQNLMSAHIEAFRKPNNFTIPQEFCMFNGSSDQVEHIMYFNQKLEFEATD